MISEQLFRRSLFAVLFAILSSGAVTVSLAQSDDKTISVSEDDPEMNAAIAKARTNLNTFWQKRANPSQGEQGFSLKLALTDGGLVEHFWCVEIEGDASDSTCVISNDPQSVMTVKLGERIKVDNTKISDWMYLKDNKIVGGQTIRVLLKSLPADEAESLRAQLADE
jgi:uncharacterized protein YegJ (DUF2314 family)